MDALEQEAANDLKKLGLKSVWACKDGVFMDSADAFKVVKLLKDAERQEKLNALKKESHPW